MAKRREEPPQFLAARMEKVRVIKRRIEALESQIDVSVDLAKISTYSLWKKLESKIRNSINILMESMVARNTVDEEASSGTQVKLRKTNDDDRRELASDIRALKSLINTCNGSDERVSRLKMQLKAAKADLENESIRSLE